MNTITPMTTAAMNHSIARTRLQPNCVTTGATSAKMPMGATSSTQCTMRINASVAASAMLVSGARFSAGSDAAAMPKMVMNTMTGSRLPSAAALNGLAGTNWTINCAPLGMVSAARWITLVSAPAAARSATCCSGVTAARGKTTVATRNPRTMPTSAVPQKNTSVRTTRRPTVRRSSSGFGEGAARALAQAGYDIVGVHLDRKAGLEHVAEIRRDIEQLGRKTQYFNINAADEEKRNEVLTELAKQKINVAVLLHSLAFGTLKPYIGEDVLNKANIDMTLDVMAQSLVYWAQGVVKHGLMGEGCRIFSMTSSGSTRG